MIFTLPPYGGDQNLIDDPMGCKWFGERAGPNSRTPVNVSCGGAAHCPDASFDGLNAMSKLLPFSNCFKKIFA
jgi:hypothetical protein